MVPDIGTGGVVRRMGHLPCPCGGWKCGVSAEIGAGESGLSMLSLETTMKRFFAFQIVWPLLIALASPACRRGASTEIHLTESDLPTQRLYFLSNGHAIVYVLPSGRKLIWRAAKEEFRSGEQTTACGLKAHIQVPAIEQLQHYGVSTSTTQNVSIYSFDIDGYQVDRVEDLTATQCLPVVIRVCKLRHGETGSQANAPPFFDADPPPASGPAPRVPLTTVHHALNQKFDFPIRLVSINGDISFEVSGDLADATEEKRVSTAEAIEKYVVDHYDGIDRTRQFSIVILKGEAPVMHYVASKDAEWCMDAQEARSPLMAQGAGITVT